MSERKTTDIDVSLMNAKAELDDVLECGNPACITLAVSLQHLIKAVELLTGVVEDMHEDRP